MVAVPRAFASCALCMLTACAAPTPTEVFGEPGRQALPDEEGFVEAGFFEAPADAVPCDDPADALADRFFDQAWERGLRLEEREWDPDGPRFGSGLAGMRVAAQDLDADGAIDLLVADGGPVPYFNDGSGHFQRGTGATPAVGLLLAIGATDLDGDGLPELIGGLAGGDPETSSSFAVWPNLGDGAFGPPEQTFTGLRGRSSEPCSVGLGDADGDGDLDLHFCTRTSLDGAGGTELERIYLNEGGGFDEERFLALEAYDGWGVASLVSTFTDFDGDGDLDLYVIGGEPGYGWPDHPGSGLFRNDSSPSQPSFTNVAAEHGFDLSFSAMGVDAADFNGDGLLDYCMSDVGPPRCLHSDGAGGWYEPGGLGLVPDEPVFDFPETIGWSLDFRDVDNDGWLDVLHASAPDHGGIWTGTDRFPDLLWRGGPDGFEDVTDETGFGTDDQHIGMVSADFDGNGWIDVFLPAEFYDDDPLLLMNRCGSAHWVNVELRGPPENREAVGAKVHLQWGTRQQLREVHTLRATAQNPSRVHQGLGDAEAVSVMVRWPDGAVTGARDLPVDRLITAVHPDAE